MVMSQEELEQLPPQGHVKLMYLADREYGQRHGRTLIVNKRHPRWKARQG